MGFGLEPALWNAVRTVPTADTRPFPRVSLETFDGVIIPMLILAVAAAGYRTYFRLRAFKRLYPDDWFLLFAVAAMITASSLALWFRNILFAVGYSTLGAIPLQIGADIFGSLWYFISITNMMSCLFVASIFSVKLSYLFFFRRLIGHIRSLELWWWFVMAVLVLGGFIATFMPFFYVCPATSQQTFVDQCHVLDVYTRSATYLKTSVAIDITTDVLVISVPIHLLSQVHIDWRRKLAVATILCLSVFMIVVAAVRVSIYAVRGIPDTPFLFFMLAVEASVAVFMVSSTAFRGLFNQRSQQRDGAKRKQRRPHNRPRIRIPGAEDPFSGSSYPGDSGTPRSVPSGWRCAVFFWRTNRSGGAGTGTSAPDSSGLASCDRERVRVRVPNNTRHHEGVDSILLEKRFSLHDNCGSGGGGPPASDAHEPVHPAPLRLKSSSRTFVADTTSAPPPPQRSPLGRHPPRPLGTPAFLDSAADDSCGPEKGGDLEAAGGAAELDPGAEHGLETFGRAVSTGGWDRDRSVRAPASPCSPVGSGPSRIPRPGWSGGVADESLEARATRWTRSASFDNALYMRR